MTKQDHIQLTVTIGGKEKTVATLKELRGASSALNKEIQNLTPGTEEFRAKAEQLRTVNARLDAIKADIKGVGNEMEKAGSGFSNFAGGMKESLMAMAPLGAAAVGAFAADKLIQFAGDAVNAYNEAENAAFQMHNAIVTLAGESEESFQRLIDQADMLEQTTFGFTAEQINATQVQLKQFNLTTAEIEKLTPKILDYAAATGKDLASATDDVTNAMLGKDKALQKVGIQLAENEKTVQGVTNSLDKFAGTAAAALEVGTNSTERFYDAWGKVEEGVGGFLANAGLTLLDWLTPIGEGLAQLWNYLTGVYTIAKSIVTPIINFVKGLADAYPILGQVGNALWSIMKPFGAIGDGLKLLISYMASFTASVIAGGMTIRDEWNNLGTYITQSAAAIGKVILQAISNPFNIGAVLTEARATFASAGTSLATTFKQNYEKVMANFSPVQASASPSTGGPIADRKIKPENDINAEVAKEKKIAEEKVKVRTATSARIIQDNALLEAELLRMAGEADAQMAKNKKATVESSEVEIMDVRARALRAQNDIELLLAGDNADAILQVKRERILLERELELENITLTAEERQRIILQADADLAALQATAAQERENAQAEIFNARKDAAFSLAIQGLDAVSQFSSMIADKQIADAERVKNARISKLDQERKRGLISEAQYNERRAAIEDATARKIAAQKRKAAIADKVAAILQAGINTAVAITAALKSDPTGILSAIVGAQGALQIGLIAAKPIPQFAKGGVLKGASHAQGGIAMIDTISGMKVGEMEGDEPYMSLSGNTYKNNKRVIDSLLYSSLNLNGAPIFQLGATQRTPAAAGDSSFSVLIGEIQGLRGDISQWQRELKAYVVLSELQNTADIDSTIKKKSGR